MSFELPALPYAKDALARIFLLRRWNITMANIIRLT